MYINALDRHRLFGAILTLLKEDMARTKPPKAMVEGSVGSTSDISHLCNLGKAHGKKMRVGRSRLVVLMAQAFQLDRSDADALLWLFDGDPLREEELKYFRERSEESPSRQFAEDYLAGLVVDLLSRVIGFQRQSYDAKVHIVFPHNAESRIAASRRLMEIESESGVLLLTLRDLSPLFFPPESEFILRTAQNDPSLKIRRFRSQFEGFQCKHAMNPSGA